MAAPRPQEPRARLTRTVTSCALAAALIPTALVPAVASPVASPVAAAPADGTVELQLLGVNDVHGRLEPDLRSGVAGLPVLAGAVAQLRAENPATVLVSAGDTIGASTFTSFIAQDSPTIEAFNAAGLAVSAAGNHEFDRGFADLAGRVADEADFPILGANVYAKGTQDPVLPESWVTTVEGVTIGFVGVVTAQTPSLVSPAGIADLDFGDPVEALDRVSAELADEVDVVVGLVHEGAETTSCAQIGAADDAFGRVVRETSADVDVIFSGHTHLGYACAFDLAGSDVQRPVVQGGQYGSHLARVRLTWDTAAEEVVGVATDLLPTVVGGAPAYPADPAVQAVVTAATAAAAEAGAVEVGTATGAIRRAFVDGVEDRGSESSLGSLVADSQRWATSRDNPAYGGAETDLAFTNPGGLRADLPAGTLTYRDVANVQPFANTLVVLEMRGSQVRQALEEQWQPAGSTRPKLYLGTSGNLTYTYLEEAERGAHITSVTVDGEPLDPTATYRVAVNSFLASGGDGFAAFAEAASRADSGQIDLEAVVSYVAAHSPITPPELGRSIVSTGSEPTPVPTTPAPSPTPTPTAGPTTPAPSPTVTPTRTPTTGADWVRVDLRTGQVRVGGVLRATLTGLEPGQRVTATVYSTPVEIGTFTADADGEIAIAWTVPSSLPVGEHRLVLTSDGLDPVEVELEVLAATSEALAATGATLASALLVALALLGAGAGVLHLRRRAAGRTA